MSDLSQYWTVKAAADKCGASYTAVYSAATEYGTIPSAVLADGTRVVTLDGVRAWMAGDRSVKPPLNVPGLDRFAGAAYTKAQANISTGNLYNRRSKGTIRAYSLGCGFAVFDVKEVSDSVKKTNSVRKLLIGKSARVRQIVDALKGAEGRVRVQLNGKFVEATMQISKDGVVFVVDPEKEVE